MLGVVWNNKRDILIYDFSELIKEAKTLIPTKRNVLRILSSFFDPLGSTQPVIIGLKILMQTICKEKLDWDEILPHNLLKIWQDCLIKLENLGNIEISRRFEIGDTTNPVIKRELHGFCDASLNGYGACIYVKTFYESGNISISLLCSKSRVAPLKQETIPRLELLGALLLSRLMFSVSSSLKEEILIDSIY